SRQSSYATLLECGGKCSATPLLPSLFYRSGVARRLPPQSKMSIATKTGDAGTTALMYGRRVPKNHPRIEAGGSIDELNAAIGLARAAAKDQFISEKLLPIQQDLITIMGELATLPEDLPRYSKDGYALVLPEMVVKLDEIVRFI